MRGCFGRGARAGKPGKNRSEKCLLFSVSAVEISISGRIVTKQSPKFSTRSKKGRREYCRLHRSHRVLFVWYGSVSSLSPQIKHFPDQDEGKLNAGG